MLSWDHKPLMMFLVRHYPLFKGDSYADLYLYLVQGKTLDRKRAIELKHTLIFEYHDTKVFQDQK